MRIKTIYQRPRMDKLMNDSLEVPLTAVVAGAGYGKTTAAREFLKKGTVPYAMITLTSGSAEVFWDKLCSAVGEQSPAIAKALEVLGLPIEPWPISRAVKLVKELCTQPFILCVDDYQYLPEDSPIHKLLETLVFENIQNLHILILSRTQPNVRLATLVSKDMARCIDVEELSFTEKETEGYLMMRGLRLTKGAVESIFQASGGWVSAIYLLGEGIRAGGQMQKSSIDALFTENLMRLLPEIDRDMLCRISVFEVFSLDLAADALGSERIRDVIEHLLRENAFVTRDERGLCRFHPLFRDYLLARCPDDERQKNFCYRAGIWSLERSAYDWVNPLALAERAGCEEKFFALMNKSGMRHINFNDRRVVCRIAMRLPLETCYKYPFLYLQVIFFMLISGRNDIAGFAMKLFNTMQEHFEASDFDEKNRILGELLVIAHTVGFAEHERESEHDALLAKAVELLDGSPSEILNPADPFTYGLPMLMYSMYMNPGDLDKEVYRAEHSMYEKVSDGFGRGSEKLARAEAALLRCRFDEAKRFAEQSIADAAEKQQFFIMSSALFTLMRRSLFLGDTEEASARLADIRELITTAIHIPSSERITVIMLREASLLAECFFCTSIKNFEKIPQDFVEGTHASPLMQGLGIPQMYMARAMAAAGNFSGAERLCDSLSRVSYVCQSARLYSLILSALCRENYYGAGTGLPMLGTALEEASRDGVMLPFAENPELIPLIGKLKHGSGINEAFLAGVRAQCEAYRSIAPDRASAIRQPLSAREIEALRLSAQGKTRKDIAEALNVQEETVKKHLSSAYKKLNARGKTEAVTVARTLGIL